MPKRLRPTAPFAPAAVLVGDPGRALLLAQELLAEPKMSNHARGLWGYSGRAGGGDPLTIQATGMGGPSAAIVLTDLAKLGVLRAVRIGTCAALDGGLAAGTLIVVDAARVEGGSAAPFGIGVGEEAAPDPELTGRLRRELAGAAVPAKIASFDTMEAGLGESAEAAAADMQTATLFACGRQLGMAVAAALIVDTTATGERIRDDALEQAAKRAGRAAAAVLSP